MPLAQRTHTGRRDRRRGPRAVPLPRGIPTAAGSGEARPYTAGRARTRPRRAIARDLALRGLCRERVLACAARLLDLGFFPVGDERYRRDNSSYGLTTLLREHAACAGGEVCLSYPAKSGRRQTRALVDEPAYRGSCARCSGAAATGSGCSRTGRAVPGTTSARRNGTITCGTVQDARSPPRTSAPGIPRSSRPSPSRSRRR
ncbi:hypothetical protein ACIBG6_07515 [Streptomyces sp. NPDC050842]|uniref:hypothetical protein n=1 Tax=Streptomyces sp. NPDC050842 TaxID=3365636 RepID=UPI0037A2CAA0